MLLELHHSLHLNMNCALYFDVQVVINKIREMYESKVMIKSLAIRASGTTLKKRASLSDDI